MPIRRINFKDASDKALHDKVVSLVDQMLSLNAKKPNLRTEQERTQNDRLIEATAEQIDALAIQLYGLTSEEAVLLTAAG